jgi:hypothetical protein
MWIPSAYHHVPNRSPLRRAQLFVWQIDSVLSRCHSALFVATEHRRVLHVRQTASVL